MSKNRLKDKINSAISMYAGAASLLPNMFTDKTEYRRPRPVGGQLSETVMLKPVTLDEKYRKEWNESLTDFCHLYRNDEKVSDTLYRVGGMGGKYKDGYIMLLKYTEAYYEDSITKDKSKKKHLEGLWCILDKDGNEKVVFTQFASPYLQGGQIYCINSEYYNIETGELYCYASSSMASEEFIFLDNKFDKDESRRGVMKINKADGSYEIFK